MRTRRALLVVTLVLLIGFGILPTSAQQTAPGPLGHRRFERTFTPEKGWSSFCDFDVCGEGILFNAPVRTPHSVEAVDLTMTVTIDYRTGPEPGDFAVARADFSRGKHGRRQSFHPRWRLGPVDTRTTTTLVWQKRNVPARGRKYFFEMTVPSREGGNDDNQNFVRGRGYTVVIEMWPAGR